MRRAAGVLFVAAMTLAVLAPGASAVSSGEITRAVAKADWSTASIAGSVTWGCTLPPQLPMQPIGPEYPGGSLPKEPAVAPSCDWTPYATVAPGSDPSDCKSSARIWPNLGTGVTLAWFGGVQKQTPGGRTFDVANVPLQGGEPQLVCLSLIATAPERPVCIALYPFNCPPWIMAKSFHALDTALLTKAVPPLDPTQGLGPAPFPAASPLASEPQAPKPKKCRKKPRPRAQSGARKCGKKRSGPRGHKDAAHK